MSEPDPDFRDVSFFSGFSPRAGELASFELKDENFPVEVLVAFATRF